MYTLRARRWIAVQGQKLTPSDEEMFLHLELGSKNKQKQKKKSADSADEQPEYEVESIVEVKKVQGVFLYVIKWKGYDETTEESFTNLDSDSKKIAQRMKKDYEAKHGTKVFEKKGHGAKSGTKVCIFCVKECIFCHLNHHSCANTHIVLDEFSVKPNQGKEDLQGEGGSACQNVW